MACSFAASRGTAPGPWSISGGRSGVEVGQMARGCLADRLDVGRRQADAPRPGVLPSLVRIARAAERKRDAGLLQGPGDDDLAPASPRGPRRSGAISRISRATFCRLAIEKRGLSLRWSSPSNTRSGPMLAGQQPQRQRRIAERRDAMCRAGRAAASASMPRLTMRILFLDGVQLPGRDIGLEVLGREVAGADRADLALLLQVFAAPPSSPRSAWSGPANG